MLLGDGAGGGPVVVGHVVTSRQGAGVQASVGELATTGVAFDLEDACVQRHVSMLRGCREIASESVEQVAHSDAVQGRAEVDRVEVAGGRETDEGGQHLRFGRRRSLANVSAEHLLVMLGDPLDELVEEECTASRVHSGMAGADTPCPVECHGVTGKCPTDGGHGLVVRRSGPVDLVHENEEWDP